MPEVITQTAPDRTRRLQRAYWATTTLAFLSPLAALACLRKYHSPLPWSRLDVFSAGYLVLSTLAIIAISFGFNRAVFRSMTVLREAAGLSYDPKLTIWAAILTLLEFAIYLDYAHWRLVPALERPPLQWLGLVVAIAAAGWVIWTDRYLVVHFSSEAEQSRLMTGGPYRFMRHPRYTSLLLAKIGAAFALASVIGWVLALGWLIVILRRIHLEEPHLRKLFGAQYEKYAARTSRILPGIY